MSDPFIAEIKIFAGDFAPRGWSFCNGQLLPIAQNTALFALVGTTYGGDGRTSLGLPNLQGRAPMHPGRGPGLTPRKLGERSGTETVTLSEAQMASHSHTLGMSSGATDEEGISDPTNALTGEPDASDTIYGPANNLVQMDASALANVGGNQPHNNMQPFLTLNYIIALMGIFPSRN